VRRLHDIPAFGAPVELLWRQRRYRCAEPACRIEGFSEDHRLVTARAKLTGRAAWWAISYIGDPHFEVTVAWRCYQQLRSGYHTGSLAEGRAIAEKVLESFPGCPIPEIARLGRTLCAWKEQFLAYFTTGGASNGGTEAIKGIIELHRRIARGFRNPTNYRLRMILAAGRLTHPNLR
jgi:transposase